MQVVNKRKKDRGPLMMRHVPTNEKESLPDRRQVERIKALLSIVLSVDWEIKTQRATSANRTLANDARFFAVSSLSEFLNHLINFKRDMTNIKFLILNI